MVHGSSFFDFGEGENRLPDRTLAARGLEENGDQIDYDIMRRYHTIPKINAQNTTTVNQSFFRYRYFPVSDTAGIGIFRSVLLYCKLWREHIFKFSRELFF